MSVTKDCIIAKVNKDIQLSRRESQFAVETLIRLIKETITTEGDLLISSFGKFKVLNKAARKGRNPKTSETMTITARKVVSFIPAANFMEIINNSEAKSPPKRILGKK